MILKMISTSRSTYPAILKQIWLPILELLPFFHQICKMLILFVLYFKNYLEIDVKFKLQKCAACQDLPTLQFLSKSHYPFWPIMQIRKKGGWNLKKSSPLKLLSQSQPNFAEMILGSSPFKMVSSAPSCIQDGHHY